MRPIIFFCLAMAAFHSLTVASVAAEFSGQQLEQKCVAEGGHMDAGVCYTSAENAVCCSTSGKEITMTKRACEQANGHGTAGICPVGKSETQRIIRVCAMMQAGKCTLWIRLTGGSASGTGG